MKVQIVKADYPVDSGCWFLNKIGTVIEVVECVPSCPCPNCMIKAMGYYDLSSSDPLFDELMADEDEDVYGYTIPKSDCKIIDGGNMQ